jgi:hypothetical protein
MAKVNKMDVDELIVMLRTNPSLSSLFDTKLTHLVEGDDNALSTNDKGIIASIMQTSQQMGFQLTTKI